MLKYYSDVAVKQSEGWKWLWAGLGNCRLQTGNTVTRVSQRQPLGVSLCCSDIYRPMCSCSFCSWVSASHSVFWVYPLNHNLIHRDRFHFHIQEGIYKMFSMNLRGECQEAESNQLWLNGCLRKLEEEKSIRRTGLTASCSSGAVPLPNVQGFS